MINSRGKKQQKFPKIYVSIDRCGCYPNACWESGVSSTSKNINSSWQTKGRQPVKQEWWRGLFDSIVLNSLDPMIMHWKQKPAWEASYQKNSNNNKINIKWWKDYRKQGNCTSTCSILLWNKSLDLSPVKTRLLFQEITSLLHQEIHARLSYHCMLLGPKNFKILIVHVQCMCLSSVVSNTIEPSTRLLKLSSLTSCQWTTFMYINVYRHTCMHSVST